MTTTHYYVQRHQQQGERSYLVRRQSGREPSPIDVVVRQFEQQADAHEYCRAMNETQERIEQQKGAARSE